MKFLLLSLAIVLPLSSAWRHNAQPSPRRLDIVLCQQLVPDAVQQMNWSASLVYAVRTNAHGKVMDVTRLRTSRFPDAAIVDCMKGWTLPIQSASTNIVWRWQHGQGWTSLSIGKLGDSWKLTLNPAGHW